MSSVMRRIFSRRMLRALGIALASSALLLVLLFAVLWFTVSVERADLVRFDDAITVVDRNGADLRHVRSEGYDRRWVELDDISPHLINAVLAVEDARFYEHSGVDLRALVRAFVFNLIPGGRLSGASTISQQVIKLIYGRPQGLWSKPAEIVRAIKLEKLIEKEEILEQYLNRLPFGDQIEGVGRASEEYFGKPASELTVAEAALIAGIPQSPSITEPRRHLPRALLRRQIVLGRMLETRRIDEATHAAAIDETPRIRTEVARPWRAPRYVDAALRQWRDDTLRRHGRRLRTSLDLNLQRQTQSILRRSVDQLDARGVENGAALVVANSTGEILAYVGAARQGADQPAGQMDLLGASRQPGSTLKPFVYELFFERGGTAATVLDDISRPMTGAGETLFVARDYDGLERGPVRAREALASSLNLAALDASRRVGYHRIVARLRRLGIERLHDADHYGAAIVLGGVDITPIELVTAYMALARGGTRIPLSFAPGGHTGEPVQVMEAESAAITADILSDAVARAHAFGDDLTSLLDVLFGLKTGTSSGWHDAWAAVFTDHVTVVVWLGDPGGRPLGGVSGFDGAAEPAVRILAEAHHRAVEIGLRPPEREPVELVTAPICAATGLLASDHCPRPIQERFSSATIPSSHCRAHRDDGTLVLPHRYARWMNRARPAGVAIDEETHITVDALPRIVHPRDGARWLLDGARGHTQVPLRAIIAGSSPPDIRWEVDGAPHQSQTWIASPGTHSFVAIWQNRRSEAVEVTVVRTGG